MAGPAFARSISAPLVGNRIVFVMCSGSRMTRWSSFGSTLTNAFIRLSSLNSCALAVRTAATRTHAAIAEGTNSASGAGIARRFVIGAHLPSQVTTTAGSVVAPGRLSDLLVVPVAVVPALVPRVVVAKRHVGVAGRPVRGRLGVAQVSGGLELLDAPAVDGFTREQVSPGIERDRVQEDEVACHVPGTPESGEDGARPRAALDRRAGRRLTGERELAIERPDDLVAPVDLEEEALVLVDGEVEVPRRSGRAEDVLVRAVGSTRGHASPGDHGDDLDGLANGGSAQYPDGWRCRAVRRVLLVDQDSIAGAVAYVQVSVLTDDQAMGVSTVAGREAAAVVRRGVGVGAVHHHAAPVPEPLAVAVEHDHAVVAVPVRDVDAASLSGHGVRVRIHPHVRWLVQESPAVVGCGVASRVAAGIGRGVVADAAQADLQQQLASVVRVLLDDAVSIAGDPDVVLVVDEQAMDSLRHSAQRPMARRASVAADRVDRSGPPRRRGGHDVRRPGVHHVPRPVELDDRGRWMRDHRLRRHQVALGTAGDDEDVIVRVDAVSGDLAGHPGLGGPGPGGAIAVSRGGWIGFDVGGERLWPERIDLEAGSVVAVVCDRLLQRAPETEPDDQRGHDGTEIHEAPFLHGDLLVELK